MTEVMNLLMQLTRDFEVIRAYVLALRLLEKKWYFGVVQTGENTGI